MKAGFIIGGLALAAGAIAVGTARAEGGPAMRGSPATHELDEGKALYAHWCAPCHAAHPGLAGTSSLRAKYEGQVPAALEDREDLQPIVISYFVRNGVSWMPPFRPTEISDAQLDALAAYLTAPLEDRGEHAQLLADEMVQLKQEKGR